MIDQETTSRHHYSDARQKLKQCSFFIELAVQLMDGTDREDAYRPLTALVEEALISGNQGLHHIVQSYVKQKSPNMEPKINFDTPQPDPAWNYYAWWNWLYEAKHKIEEAIITLKDVEDSTPDIDEKVKALASEAKSYLTDLTNS